MGRMCQTWLSTQSEALRQLQDPNCTDFLGQAPLWKACAAGHASPAADRWIEGRARGLLSLSQELGRVGCGVALMRVGTSPECYTAARWRE